MKRAEADRCRRYAGWGFSPHPYLDLCLVLLFLAGLPAPLASQTNSSATEQTTNSAPKRIPQADDEVANTPRATLHVYTNLMQVPVLILDSDHERLKPIPESKFRIRLDSGPPFQPTHVRREGDDPIQLALLIDTSDRNNELLPGIADAMAALVPGSLRPWDSVSVYTLDCGVIRTALAKPADAPGLQAAIDRGMVGWHERRHQKHWPGCGSSVQLFDAMTVVSSELTGLPGRRVMLVLSDGTDRGSRNGWSRLMRYDQTHSITIFGLRSRQQMEDEHVGGFNARQNPFAAGLEQDNVRNEDQFDMICQLTGGVQFATSDLGLKKRLARFIQMLRERYIIEYPRSNTATAGTHDLLVTIPDPWAYVRPAGISVPLADQRLLANPMTLPSHAEVPFEGPRRVLGTDEPSSGVSPTSAPSPPALPPP